MTNLNKDSKILLNNETQIPVIGFGVFRIPEGEEVVSAVRWALEAGYRLIDTAMIYGNEEGVGKAIKDCIQDLGIPREEIFVTTKLWNTDQGYESALAAIDVSLAKLGMDYVDLYLIHWPTASGNKENFESINKREETWKAMEEIYKSGKAKAIGVSNYMINHLEEMKNYAKVSPAVNQVEFHPFLFKENLLNYCKENNIVLEAHSPLVHGEKLDTEIIKSIAEKYGKSSAQVLLRWSLQHGLLPLPKSSHKERIEENLNVFDFELTAEEMKSLNDLNANLHLRPNPTNLK